MKEYKFYGWQTADCKPADSSYEKIQNPRHLYDILSEIWCEYTCAPRLRENWSRENQTLGQCSITAFLAQDIFGGKVYGILREGGNYHCYENNPEQFRETHWQKTEKHQRYNYLKAELLKKLEEM